MGEISKLTHVGLPEGSKTLYGLLSNKNIRISMGKKLRVHPYTPQKGVLGWEIGEISKLTHKGLP